MKSMHDVCEKLDRFVVENCMYNLMVQINSDSVNYRMKTHCFSHNTYPEYDEVLFLDTNAEYDIESLDVDMQIIRNWSALNHFHMQFMIVNSVVLRVVLHRNYSDIMTKEETSISSKLINFITPDYECAKIVLTSLFMAIPILYILKKGF